MSNDHQNYVCPYCKTSIENKKECCGIYFKKNDKYFEYDFDKILFDNHRNKYLLNKVLNNNGTLSYMQLPDSSLSLDTRECVKHFGSYVKKHYSSGNIIDIGCGTMEIPGYLNPIASENCNFYGLDPMSDIGFKWNKIIGCAEYLPVSDQYFNTIIFATSIDHVCNLSKTLQEASRTLAQDGKLIIWHGYPEKYSKLKAFIRKLGSSFYYRCNRFRYSVWRDNNAVYYIPPGAVDPFHESYITVKQLSKVAKKAGLKLIDNTRDEENSFFLVYTKA